MELVGSGRVLQVVREGLQRAGCVFPPRMPAEATTIGSRAMKNRSGPGSSRIRPIAVTGRPTRQGLFVPGSSGGGSNRRESSGLEVRNPLAHVDAGGRARELDEHLEVRRSSRPGWTSCCALHEPREHRGAWPSSTRARSSGRAAVPPSRIARRKPSRRTRRGRSAGEVVLSRLSSERARFFFGPGSGSPCRVIAPQIGPVVTQPRVARAPVGPCVPREVRLVERSPTRARSERPRRTRRDPEARIARGSRVPGSARLTRSSELAGVFLPRCEPVEEGSTTDAACLRGRGEASRLPRGASRSAPNLLRVSRRPPSRRLRGPLAHRCSPGALAAPSKHPIRVGSNGLLTGLALPALDRDLRVLRVDFAHEGAPAGSFARDQRRPGTGERIHTS